MKHYFVWMLCAGLLCGMPAEAKKKKTKKEEPKAAAAQPVKPEVDRKGLFNVSRQKEDWFFEVPDSLLGRQLLMTTRYTATPSNSGLFGGELANQQTVYWEKNGENRLMLRAALFVNLADTTQTISRAITVSNENPIIASFKIESREGCLYKVKVNDLFNEDNPAISLPVSLKKKFSLTSQVQSASYIEDIRSFPLNTEVRLVKTWMSNGSNLYSVRETGRATFGLNVSFVRLPEEPMMRRYFDPRVGYFADSFNEFTDGQQRVKNKRFITRWRLEPKPEDVEKMRRGELVEPRKQIVYYIDPATPKQWRKYLIQGVNDWQKAFEAAGFKNAIVGKEWPEEDSTMSMEDARYSVIRYLAAPIENAYGPHIHDPRTGEILESHVCWYHNVMKLLHDWYMVQASTIDEAARKMHYDEELMGQLIRFVSSHEIGHTLGLRHNFGSSHTVPVDSLRDKEWVERHGHTPSIMDYARFNYVAQPEDGISREGIFPRIGDYDKWAIQWGYAPMLGATDEDSDHLLLESLMEKNLEKNPRLWFGDGETNSVRDPRCQTEDLGDDAVKASEYGIRNLKREIRSLQEWTLDADDIYNRNLSEMYNQIVQQFMRYNGHVMAWIGGMYNDFKTPGQYGDIYTPVPKSKQKEALEYINRNVFTEPAWLTSERYMSRITPTPQKVTVNIGLNVLSRLTDSYLLNNMNTEYSVYEYLKDLTFMLFSGADMRSRMSGYRMALQASFVRTLVLAFETNPRNAACRPAVLQTLRTLRDFTSRASAAAPDGESRAHYASLNDVIQRALLVK